MLEDFKSVRHENPLLIEEKFHIKERHYSLRNKFILRIPEAGSKHTVQILCSLKPILFGTLFQINTNI